MMLNLVATADIYLEEKKNFLVFFVEKCLGPFSLIIFELDSGKLQIKADVSWLRLLGELPFQSGFFIG